MWCSVHKAVTSAQWLLLSGLHQGLWCAVATAAGRGGHSTASLDAGAHPVQMLLDLAIQQSLPHVCFNV
jgi:hypothetical protein